ncbi:unnamed protein product [Ostreobium quekettii]|uniref:Uncharacterized protein n=1 Tax=Ostreobium quekettii TaxID=121088 RepID=A0A8S1JBA3_9CHLO|nr:unnamed protein product [Ostreobium quekettii]|eukprot:evm.model.scf_131.17 EVM.evm.TU.scf_131.17   scf_131:112143-112799(-)
MFPTCGQPVSRVCAGSAFGPLADLRRALPIGTAFCRSEAAHCASSLAAHGGTPPLEALNCREWAGLGPWRNGEVDQRRGWGAKGPTADVVAPGAAEFEAEWRQQLPGSLAECGRLVLDTADPMRKAALTHRIWEAWNEGKVKHVGTKGPRRTRTPVFPAITGCSGCNRRFRIGRAEVAVVDACRFWRPGQVQMQTAVFNASWAVLGQHFAGDSRDNIN